MSSQIPQTNTSTDQFTNNFIQERIAAPVTYLCGDCSHKVSLKSGDPVRCTSCGHRVLYKMRTTQIVQFEAR